MSATTRIGTYEVLGILGDGGMGTVYKGRDPRFDRPVAIKVLHPQFQRDPGVVERFKAEAVIQARLNHPNIVTVFDFVADESTLAMVMEFVDGSTLGDLIEATGPMAPDRAVALISQALSAMAFAHSQGLVHRDIKPSNMIVQDLGGEEVLKVMDFGIAKILGSEKMRTATGAKMGTLAYMSPEQIRSPKSVDARSDVYSLGIVLYEMLTGRAPFEADSEYELMEKILTKELVFLPAPSSGIAEDLQALSRRATSKSPEERFADAAAFRDALVDPPPAIGAGLRLSALDAPAAAGSEAEEVCFEPAETGTQPRSAAYLSLKHLWSTPAGWTLAAFLVLAAISLAYRIPRINKVVPRRLVVLSTVHCYVDSQCQWVEGGKVRDATTGECAPAKECDVLWKCSEGPKTGSCGGGWGECTLAPGCPYGLKCTLNNFCVPPYQCNDKLLIR